MYLVNILNNALEGLVKRVGVVEVSHHLLEGGCVVESVTDTLVGGYLKGDEMVIFLRTIGESNLLCIHLSVGKEKGKMTKVVEVMIDSGDTERSH